VYVLQSLEPRPRGLPGFHYVGCTTDPVRRLRQHNGEIVGGAKYTSKHRPWVARALYGPYSGKVSAMKAEYALKHGKRGTARTRWSPEDSIWCRGAGPDHPWVSDPTKDPSWD
jgi:predicted GIY-YIG superfamily endonuclease